jgi:hypothetical protein
VKSFQDEEQLVHNLGRLITEGGQSNFLIVSVGEVYVQFAASRGDKEVYCEAVSNEFLPPGLQLAEDKISQLRGLGFEDPGASPNLSRTFDVTEEAALPELARLTHHILSNVYGCDAQSRLQFELVLE